MKKIFKIIGGAFLALIVIGAIFSKLEKNKEPVYINIGEPLKTSSFEVIVNDVKIDNSVNTGNIFNNLNAEEGIVYLILDTNFKNIDKKTKTLRDGDLLIVYNASGETFKYDHSEHILTKGWGIFLDSINPGITKKTKLVYKIPSDLSNVSLYYVPYRAPINTYIFLGTIE